jgi:benzoate-CoA ligase family protein
MTAFPTTTSTPGSAHAAPPTFNAAEYLLDSNLAAGRAGSVAVLAGERALDYGGLAQEVARVAAGLRALGVRPEERVLMCMADDVELFAAILAVLRIGAVAVPCSTMLTGAELGVLVADSRARVVLASTAFAPAVLAAVTAAAEVTDVVFDGEPGQPPAGVRAHSWAAAFGRPAALEPAHPTWADSPALWLYTSGTTGTPKAAMHRHQDIQVVAEQYGQQVLGITAADRCLSVAKLFFAYGIGNSMFFPLSVGASTVLEPARPAPATIAALARQHAATLLFGVPSFWGPLLAAVESDVPADAFATVRQGVSAGETLPPRMFHGVRDRFGLEVLDGIGSTEMLHIFVSNRPGAVHPGSSGTPVPGYEVRLRDEQGGLITEPDVPGELYVRGESAAIGYWCRAAASRRVFLGDWMRTGDTYTRNADGTYTCLGRLGDMLKVGGIWVTPAEVEDRLLGHPGVAEAVVVGVPDADALDKPVACVVPTPGAVIDEADLIAWCRAGLAAFKRPRAVVALTELPKTATGKIRRNVLRAQLRDDLR